MSIVSTVREPLFRYRPPVTSTIGDLAAKFGREQLALDPDPEQVWVLDTIYAERSPGIPVCFEVDVVAPRQNIKSSTFEIAALFDLFVLRVPLSVWTAHEFKTARKSFEDMKRRIGRNPDLRDSCTIRDSHGEERITLHTGESLEFHARSGGSGRGFTCDRLTLDEGLFLEPADMGAILPTLATIAGAQVRMGSSAGKMKSEVLRGIRDSGRAGSDSGQAYVEYGAQRQPCEAQMCLHSPDTHGCALDDRELWWQANSALWAGRITEERIERFRKRMPAMEFAREFLSWWDDPIAGGALLDPTLWAVLSVGNKPPVAPVLSLEVALDGSRTSVGAAWMVDDKPHVEVFEDLPGTDVVPRMVEHREKYGAATAVVDCGTQAADLVPALKAAGFKVVEVTKGSERATACAGFFTAATTEGLTHNGDPAVAAALAAARWKDVGEGARAFTRRKSAGDIAALYAVTLALYGLAGGPAREFWGAWG